MSIIKSLGPVFMGKIPTLMLQNVMNMKGTYTTLYKNIELLGPQSAEIAANAYEEAEAKTTKEANDLGNQKDSGERQQGDNVTNQENGESLMADNNGNSTYVRPVSGGTITSRHGDDSGDPEYNNGNGHYGIDIALPEGSEISVAISGVIIDFGNDASPNDKSAYGGYGNYVKIKGDDGNIYYYAHMKNVSDGFAKGDRINAGDLIGYVGSTGNSTGNHLHFEIRDPHNNKLDPEVVMPGIW